MILITDLNCCLLYTSMYASCPYDVPQAQVVTCKFFNDANLYGALQCFLLDEKEKALIV